MTEIAHPIRLSPDLVLEADEIVGAGINIFGVKGSGKTGTVARLAEQAAAPSPATAAAGVSTADRAMRRVTAPPPVQPALPEQTAHLWPPVKPGPPLPSPHRLSQPIAAMPLARPAKARLTPALEQAVGAWQAGATSVTKLEAALNITHHQAYKLYRQLYGLRLV